jgi:methyl-accepting chemotaxis protein
MGDRTIPNLTLGGRSTRRQPCTIVDQVKELVDGTATVFVRAGEDFIRVSTNVMKEDQRAVGTLLDPSGAADRGACARVNRSTAWSTSWAPRT